VLHGRDAELRELTGAVAAALADGRGLVALITGDAGIGKTRLAHEVASALRAGGVRVAWAVCRADDGTAPYWPWAQLLAALGRRDALVAPPGDPALARFRLHEAVGAAVAAAAPILLVLDDLHWADRPSLRLLESLVPHTGTAPVVVLGTYRDTEPGPAATLAADRRVVLRGLDVAALGPALEQATGEEVPADVLASVHRRTGGNPFFAAEIVRMLRGTGSAGELPPGVRAVLDRRLDGLPEGAETPLRALAALDPAGTSGADDNLLAQVVGCSPARLAELLDTAVNAGLVARGEDEHRFCHGLVAEALAARTPPAERVDLHRRAGTVLTRRWRSGDVPAAQAAAHLLTAARRSGEPADAGPAIELAVAAADAATAAAAHEDAVQLLDRALPLAADGAPRAGLLCRLGEAALAAGDLPRARTAFTTAAEHARRAGDPELLAAAALGLTGGAAGFEVDLTDPGRVAVLDEALAALPPHDSVLRCAVLARLSVALTFTDGEPRRRELAEQAVAVARRLADPAALATALAALCDATAGPAHVEERRAAASAIVTAARQAGDVPRELLGRRLRVVALAEAGRWADVDREIDAYAAAVAPLRRPGLSWYVPLWRAARAAMQGRDPADHVAELTALVARSGSLNAELLRLTQQFIFSVLAGRPDEESLARFFELAPEDAATRCTQALVWAASGRPGAAELLADYLDHRLDGPADSEWLPEMVQSAQVAVLIGDRQAAARLRRVLEPYADLFAIEGILAGTWGCVAGHLAALADLLGDPGAARAHRETAAAADAVAGSGVGAVIALRSRPVPVAEAVFQRDGEGWRIGFAGRTVVLRDSKGMHDLAVLLARPGVDVAAHELAGTRPVVAVRLELADRTAIDAYRRRLAALADAADDGDTAAAAERAALLRQLSAVTGRGGRVRSTGTDDERVRKAVGNRIRLARERIAAVHPELGRHLRASVRTGTHCRYDPERPVDWVL